MMRWLLALKAAWYVARGRPVIYGVKFDRLVDRLAIREIPDGALIAAAEIVEGRATRSRQEARRLGRG